MIFFPHFMLTPKHLVKKQFFPLYKKVIFPLPRLLSHKLPIWAEEKETGGEKQSWVAMETVDSSLCLTGLMAKNLILPLHLVTTPPLIKSLCHFRT